MRISPGTLAFVAALTLLLGLQLVPRRVSGRRSEATARLNFEP
jgi:hypothetical protein